MGVFVFDTDLPEKVSTQISVSQTLQILWAVFYPRLKLRTVLRCYRALWKQNLSSRWLHCVSVFVRNPEFHFLVLSFTLFMRWGNFLSVRFHSDNVCSKFTWYFSNWLDLFLSSFEDNLNHFWTGLWNQKIRLSGRTTPQKVFNVGFLWAGVCFENHRKDFL